MLLDSSRPLSDGPSLTDQTDMTDAKYRAFCQNPLLGAAYTGTPPFRYSAIGSIRNCYCGNTYARGSIGKDNSHTTYPNSGNSSRVGSDRTFTNVWDMPPRTYSSSSASSGYTSSSSPLVLVSPVSSTISPPVYLHQASHSLLPYWATPYQSIPLCQLDNIFPPSQRIYRVSQGRHIQRPIRCLVKH